jgi:hypothetical protein
VAKKRRRRGSSKRRGAPRLLVLVLLGLVIAGFLTRRMLVPRALYFLTHRPAPGAVAPETGTSENGAQGVGTREQAGDPSDEKLTDSDRRQFKDLINSKVK